MPGSSYMNLMMRMNPQLMAATYGGMFPTIPQPFPAPPQVQQGAGPGTSGKSKRKKKGANQVALPTEADCPGTFSMLLCSVIVGRTAPGSVSLRRPPDGFDSVYGAGAHGTKNYAVFDNSQAYPSYLVHFDV